MPRSRQTSGNALAQGLRLGRIEPRGRFIEQQQRGFRHQGANELDALLHAVRQAADGGMLVSRKAGIGQRRPRLLAPAVARPKTDRLQYAR